MNSSLNTNDNHNVTIEGWVPQTDGRGTLDIIWSCTITIFLCCWTSVCANIPATTDSPWNWFRDKLGLACMGILWPDFLFGLALGQWDSARRSVEKFHSAGYLEWTMSHAFFADMGGFIIQFSDCISFPVDAEQLHYLISKGYLEYPKLDKAMIDDKNKADNLSRCFTVFQVFWFSINCIGRLAQHIDLTTIELTTIGFIFVMLATSFCWWHKPLDVSMPIILKSQFSITDILNNAGISVHDQYRHTPLEFVNRHEWFMSLLWAYYTQILGNMYIRIFSRPVKARPIDRIPSDHWALTNFKTEVWGAAVTSIYSAIFVLGWNLSFPSWTECILWRVASVIALVYGIIGGSFAWYCHRIFLPNRKARTLSLNQEMTNAGTSSWFGGRARKAAENLRKVAESLRNNSPDHDPAMEVPIRMLIPATLLCFTYCISRAYILVEDGLGLRRLPSSAFSTVDWSQYLPHL